MNWPISDNFCRSAMINGGSTYSLNVPDGASANSKGDWTVLSASTPFDAHQIMLCINGCTYNDYLFDLGIGAEGSETEILSNLLISAAEYSSFNYGYRVPTHLVIPISIPSGTRVVARCQSPGTTHSVDISMFLFQRGMYNCQLCAGVDTIGASTGDSGGTGLADCGGSADTYGGYTELSSSTPKNYLGYFISCSLRNNLNASAGQFYVDLAIGASSSELNIATALGFRPNTYSHIFERWTPIIWTKIPSGTRLSARYKSTITDATDRLIDVVFYGIY